MIETGCSGGEAKAERIIVRGYVRKTVGESLLGVSELVPREHWVCRVIFCLHERPLPEPRQAAHMSRNRMR